ncbi:MAG: hypothetical protein IPL50_09525 [Chitinophagaceae bacterium]|nr:hypothetical protein [Chitinophagaceae bacterium]
MNDPLMNAALDMEVYSKIKAPIEFICADITGRILLHRPLNVPAGSSRLLIDIRKFAKGIYWIYAIGKGSAAQLCCTAYLKVLNTFHFLTPV